MRGGWRVWGFALLLLGIMAAEMAGSAQRESLSWDEGDHLFAGYMSLRTGDFGFNPEHPPMAKMVAALPMTALKLRVPPPQGRFFKDEAYFDGRELLFRQPGYSADTLLFRARMAMTVFALALALLVFGAAREMFGTGAGLLAMALVVLEPNLLTHGPFVATDSAITCCFFATVWALYRFVKRPSWGRIGVAGVAAGLALAAKHSAILLLPVVVLLLLGELFWHWRVRRGVGESTTRPGFSGARRTGAQSGSFRACAARMGAVFVLLSAIAIAVLWAFYGFRYQARPGTLRLDPSLSQYVQPLKPFEAKTILLFARFHLLPESWLFGLADVRRVADFMPTFFMGKVYAHGIWTYFPAVLLIKLTLGSIGLLLLALGALAAGKFRSDEKLGGGRETWFLLLPAGVYLLAAMNSQLNIGVRHVLPVIPLLLVFAAGGAWSLLQRDRRWGWAVGALFAAHAASSAWAYPNYLPYANEAWGGPAKTRLYLSDSNTDWGQQLKQVSTYLRTNGIHNCWFAYFVTPFIEPADYGIPCRLLPTFDTGPEVDLPVPPVVSGVVLMSAGDQNGFEFGSSVRNPYRELMGKRPDAVIDNGVLVYRGAFRFPLAQAIAPTQKSIRLLQRNDVAGAVREARAAVTLAPDSFDAQMQLGSALERAGDTAGAREAFGRALLLVGRMEPSAQEQWRPQVDAELGKVGR